MFNTVSDDAAPRMGARGTERSHEYIFSKKFLFCTLAHGRCKQYTCKRACTDIMYECISVHKQNVSFYKVSNM